MCIDFSFFNFVFIVILKSENFSLSLIQENSY